jgi:hypothetical protein
MRCMRRQASRRFTSTVCGIRVRRCRCPRLLSWVREELSKTTQEASQACVHPSNGTCFRSSRRERRSAPASGTQWRPRKIDRRKTVIATGAPTHTCSKSAIWYYLTLITCLCNSCRLLTAPSFDHASWDRSRSLASMATPTRWTCHRQWRRIQRFTSACSSLITLRRWLTR